MIFVAEVENQTNSPQIHLGVVQYMRFDTVKTNIYSV